MTSAALCLSSPPEESRAASLDPPFDDQYRSKLRDMIHSGLSSLRWGWLQAIAPALRKDLGTENDPSLTPAIIASIIAEAELTALWPFGWADAQLAEHRAQQRLRRPRSRRVFVARGEQIGISKLTNQGVRSIRRRYANRHHRKITIKQLARDHGVDPITIRRVLCRLTWRHIQ